MAFTEEQITERIGKLSIPSRLDGKFSLDPIRNILERLDHPERNVRLVHIGGTSGKGSTSTFLASILEEAGYRVGLFTKPHLTSVRERFILNGEWISPEEIMASLTRISEKLDEKPTWFELTTALAFQFFSENQVDVGIVEVGLGGTYDATNVIDPEISVLTNVGLDHTEILGGTIEKIAQDKVGIFKPGKPVLTGATQPSVIEIIEQKCAETGSSLKRIQKDFSFANVQMGVGGSRFDFQMGQETIPGVTLGMLGVHQVANATLALASALSLRDRGYTISYADCLNGLKRTKVDGRMEIIGEKPVIILDGAHSPPKMEALAQSVDRLFGNKRTVGVLAFSIGHDSEKTLSVLAPRLDVAVLTEFHVETDYGNKRAQNPVEFAAALERLFPRVKIIIEPDPIRALEIARQEAGEDDLVCVTGSIFLVGQIRGHLFPPSKGISVIVSTK